MTRPETLRGPLKIELGGGKNPRPGFVNVDRLPGADHVLDLAAPDLRLPFADDAADEVYAAHVLEHVAHYQPILHEIVRVCRAGARVEVRVPHWLQSMALGTGHRCTISPTQVRHWVKDFIADWWGGCAKRLDLRATDFVPGDAFAEAKVLFPHLSDDEVMRLFPDACHEVRFSFSVVPYA